MTSEEPQVDVGAGTAAPEAPGTPDAPDAPGDAAAHDDGADLVLRAEADPRDRAQLLGDLEVAERARDEYLDDLRRALADFENYRKRVARDGAVQRELGRADAVGALLDVLDDVDRAVAAAADGVDATALGGALGAIAEKARRALEGVGVARVDASGVAFDPSVHDAVQQVEDADASEPTVHQVLRPGYRLGERVLRAAMVVVAQR
jgi:molecular chaperone GrpE